MHYYKDEVASMRTHVVCVLGGEKSILLDCLFEYIVANLHKIVYVSEQ